MEKSGSTSGDGKTTLSISLRDWRAAGAFNAIIARYGGGGSSTAAIAYQYADALEYASKLSPEELDVARRGVAD